MPVPLFDHLDRLTQELDAKSLFLCLDYDGTLVPIAARPDAARISAEGRDRLQTLAGLVPVAIVSGRSLSEIQRMVGIQDIIYAGNHGLEIASKDFQFSAPTSRKWREVLAEIATLLDPLTAGVEGVFFEDKGVTASFHYRLVPREQVAEVQGRFWEVLKSYVDGGQVKVTCGKEVLEVRPPIDWDKGKALEYLLARPGLSGKFTLYIGDDETDEDAFRVLRESGAGIGVGPAREQGAARYLLDHPGEVSRFLDWLTQELS